MSAQGITFTDAHSGGAVCTPSRYGILWDDTFQIAQTWGYLGYQVPLIEQGRETIGTLLQRAGYRQPMWEVAPRTIMEDEKSSFPNTAVCLKP